MSVDSRKLKSALSSIALALALLAPMPVSHAAPPRGADEPVASARAFIQTLSQGHFGKAEARFTEQMKRAAPAQKLRQLWNSLVAHNGPFQKIGGHEMVTVIVKVEFEKHPVDLAVTFDSNRRIAGLHLLSASGASQ